MHTPGTHPRQPSGADLELLTCVISDVGRQAKLSPDDALDFGQTVHLKLIERGYDPIHQFCGRSSFRTYLTVVVRRILLDWRRAQYGKWRNSAAARRLGPTAMTLERLIYRSGHTLDEAVQVMAARPGAGSTADLERLAAQIPMRWSYRTVSIEVARVTGAADFDDPVERVDDHQASIALRHRLRAALDTLPRADRVLLDLRYGRMLRVPAIAAALNADSKAIYRRCEKALRALRTTLQADDPSAGRLTPEQMNTATRSRP